MLDVTRPGVCIVPFIAVFTTSYRLPVAVQAAKHTKADEDAPDEAAAQAADDGPAEAQAEPADGEADRGDDGEDAEAAVAEEEDAAEPAPADGDDAPDAEPDTVEKPAQMDPKSMTVAQLKEQLAERGLSVQGRKTDLYARLTEALAVRPHSTSCHVSWCKGLSRE